MTPQQVVALFVRLFAIWLCVIAIQMVAISGAFNSAQTGQPLGLWFFLAPAIPVLLAVYLWNFPMMIARKLISNSADANKINLHPRQATAAASAIMGMWILIQTIPLLFARIGAALTTEGMLRGGSVFMESFAIPQMKMELLSEVLKIIIALILLFNPWLIARKIFPASETTDKEQQPT